MSADPYASWIGRTRVQEDLATASSLSRLAALLGHGSAPPWVPDEVPPLGHWLYFLSACPQQELGSDGHEGRGTFLPPIALPRRMRAGGFMEFHAPVRVGARLRRESTIKSVETKQGRAGALVFVSIEHRVMADGPLAILETEDIVYREPAPVGEVMANAEPPPHSAQWQRSITPDAMLLFRFSALTFNAHRIHYDLPYAVEVERYPGLVVHGPLLATLLVDLHMRAHPGSRLASFSYRARRPAFEGHPVELRGRRRSPQEVDLWTLDGIGQVTMTATLKSAEDE